MLFGQRTTIQKGEVAKERRSENVVDTSSLVSFGYKIDSNTSIISVRIYVIHNMSKDPSKIFSVSSKTKIVDLTTKLLDRIAWPCRQTSTQKYCIWLILQEILKQWRHRHKIFSQKNLVQVNSDRMALSILRVSLKVAKWRHSLNALFFACIHTTISNKK